jgi:hypothetical protein
MWVSVVPICLEVMRNNSLAYWLQGLPVTWSDEKVLLVISLDNDILISLLKSNIQNIFKNLYSFYSNPNFYCPILAVTFKC